MLQPWWHLWNARVKLTETRHPVSSGPLVKQDVEVVSIYFTSNLRNSHGFSWKPHSFFFVVSFTWNLANNGDFFTFFLAHKWNWLWFDELKWLKLWNRPDSVRKKNETDGRGDAACRQFHYFKPRVVSFKKKPYLFFLFCGQFHVKLL